MGMDVYGRKPANKTGEYFHANVWSWRPIHQLCELVMDNEYPGWGYNDGAGFTTQKQCNELADKLENYLKKNPRKRIELESDMRVGKKNGMGRELFRRGQRAYEGDTAYSTTREHLREFIKFLRCCGGFRIC